MVRDKVEPAAFYSLHFSVKICRKISHALCWCFGLLLCNKPVIKLYDMRIYFNYLFYPKCNIHLIDLKPKNG